LARWTRVVSGFKKIWWASVWHSPRADIEQKVKVLLQQTSEHRTWNSSKHLGAREKGPMNTENKRVVREYIIMGFLALASHHQYGVARRRTVSRSCEEALS